MFRRPIIADPNNVVLYMKVAIALHNYLRTDEVSMYCPPGFMDGEDGSGECDCWFMAGGGCGLWLQLISSVGGNR